MLPDINLDTENFNDIVEEAKNRISSLYPQWTDYNYHDPGITLIELFAWLKEIQHFYLNQIGEQNKLSFLKLFGAKRLCKQCATVKVEIDTDEDLILPEGTRFYAGDLCFETNARKILIGKNISKCIAEQGEVHSVINNIHYEPEGSMKIFMFGKEPKAGNKFYIGFSKPLPCHKRLSINFDIFDDYDIHRNQVVSEFYPLAKLKYEYYADGEWRKVNIIREDTFNFIQGGEIYFTLEKKMDTNNVKGENGYFIRIVLDESNYDVPPVLTGISINKISIVQRETKARCYDFSFDLIEKNSEYYSVTIDSWLAVNGREIIYVGYSGYYYELTDFLKKTDSENKQAKYSFKYPENMEGNPDTVRIVCFTKELYSYQTMANGDGLPFQEFDFESQKILSKSLRIMISDIEEKGSFCEWEKVTDFQCSGPMDKHYVFEEEKGIVKFGDCKHGMAPEGEIRIIGYAMCEGNNGNVKSGTIKESIREYESIKIFNENNAYGGRNTETMEECFLRLKRSLKETIRGITNEDYECLVYKTPGLMIHSCKAITHTQPVKAPAKESENLISIVVRPFSVANKPKVNTAYYKNIINFLDQRRMIGTKIEILSPEYIDIILYLELKLKAHYIDAKAIVRNSIKDYFKIFAGEFGKPVLYSSIYGMIDMLSCVAEISSLVIDARGDKITRNPNGDVLIPPNGLVQLKDIQSFFTVA